MEIRPDMAGRSSPSWMPASRSRRASSYDFASDVWANRLLLVDSTLSPIATPRALTLEEPTPFALDEDWWHAEAPAA